MSENYIDIYRRDRDKLAQAVLAFAEWQWGCYDSDASSPARRSIGRALWFEVSEHVRRITGQTPPAPSFGPQGDELDADRGGRL
jgi:hypothetical protein